jgi:hypothetical protein
MKSFPMGYKLRPDGLYEKTCEFVNGKRNGKDTQARATIIRDKHGNLIRTIESRGTLAKLAAHNLISTPNDTDAIRPRQ